jgi:tetratricopeptide (TPR) repeat protein
MSVHGEVEVADAGARGRMLRAVRDVVARAGGARRVSGLSLMAVLCASAVAPVVLVGQELGPVLAAWLATAGSVGSNLLAEVITGVAGRREGVEGRSAEQVELAVAVELEARMAASGRSAVALRSEVAGLLRERGAQQVLLEALAEGDSDLQEALAEGLALLAGQFGEFAGLLDAVGEGVRHLQAAAYEQRGENRAQERHRDHVQQALGRILRLLERGSPVRGGSAVVYNTLPPDTVAFTGRRVEIGEVERRVTAAAALGGVIAIHAIDGMAGVGKTTLAVHVAHRLSGRFPDRQLFVDLHAHSADRLPADPAATLASLLAGDGVDPRQLPADLEDLAALWRSRMADRRALLVLDNAADSTQVAPLLPGADACLVLITSRRHLGDLPYAVADISLDVLPPEEAAAMFLRLSPRAAGQQESVAELVTLAGRLPLAITLLARVHVKHPAWSMDELISETRARLLTLTAENRTIAAAFDLSYHALPPSRQRFFRLLGLHPGSDTDAYAAAALTATSLQQATAHLDALHSDHLLTEPGYHRYGMHDLLRTYAHTHAETDDSEPERAIALDRLLHYYAHTAQTASQPIARYPRPAPDGPAPTFAPVLTDPQAARTWLRTEHPNLDAAHTHAHTHHLYEQAINLAAGMAETLLSDGPWTRALDIHQAAAEAATYLDKPTAHATALNDLGRVRYLTGDFSAAAEALTQALETFRQVGHRTGEATALIDLGQVQAIAGDYLAAAEALTQALETSRQVGHHIGEATALTHLGRTRAVAGNYLAAADALTQALGIYRQIGHRTGEATALGNLGQVRAVAGDYLAAADAHTQALEIHRQIGHRTGEATALNHLGQVRQMTGDYLAAADALTQALGIFRQIGLRPGEATALNNLGRVRHATGDFSAAADAHTQALEISRQMGSRVDEANALADLGRVRHATDDFPAAADAHAQALEIFRQIGHRANESWALNYYAATIAAGGDRPRALALYHQALAMNRELNKPDDEAISLEGIGEHYLATDALDQGITYLRQALDVYQRLGMRADIERVEARLAGLEGE